jgi:hypothetical protein
MALYAWGSRPDSAPLQTIVANSTERTLLWEAAPVTPATDDFVTRLYRHLLGFEVSVNARWDGSQWVKDVSGTASRLRIETSKTLLEMHSTAATSFGDTSWTGTFTVQPSTTAQALINAAAELQGPGQIESYVAQQCRTSTSGNTNIGSGCSFRKIFPATPSSVTFSTIASSGISSGPTAYSVTKFGSGAYCGTTASGGTAYFYARVFAS